jgi:hypothetical protein
MTGSAQGAKNAKRGGDGVRPSPGATVLEGDWRISVF